MATSRKNTTALLTQTPAFLRNNPTVLDQEKENFEKAQIVALSKSLSLEEAASKEKHVRTLIIGTFIAKGPNIFWQKVKDVIPLHGSDVVCWKFLIVLHRCVSKKYLKTSIWFWNIILQIMFDKVFDDKNF